MNTYLSKMKICTFVQPNRVLPEIQEQIETKRFFWIFACARMTIASLFLSCLGAQSLYGVKEPTNENQPVLYYADSQTYDRELGILILKGHVEFEHEKNVLEADIVTYNESTDIVTASGNVRLREPNGDINFAEYVELTGDMKDGIILQLRALLQDDSKIVAVEGRKFENHEELDQAVYTPCELCGDQSPTWQINARRVVKDNVNKNIHFTDAQMRILDTPLLYLPYLTQPLERRSGFLIPRPEYSTAFGASLEVPYFIVLSEDIDVTLSPVIFTQQNPLLLGQYRQAFGNGMWTMDGSITNYRKTDKDKKAEKTQNFEIPNTRGHILTQGKFNLTDIWRTSFEGGYVSDKTYFRKYGFSGWKNEANLTSKGVLEGFLNQRDYAAAKVYHFQGLRDKDQQKYIASALPYIEYSGYSGVDPWGGRFNIDGNFLNIYRTKGLDMQRGVGVAAWQRPWVTSLGQVYTVSASLRGDLYSVQNGKKQDQGEGKNKGFIDKTGGARFFPQTSLNWRWPFINSFQSQSVVLQPVGQLIAAPSTPIGVKSRRVPDEDSKDFSFNDANLFSFDRFPGYDLIDTGSRAVYGGEFLTTGNLMGDVEVFLGQDYSFSKLKHQDKSQGFGRRASDYVGRLEASPFSWLSLNYRFRLDQKTWNPRVSEVGGSIGPSLARLAGNYVFLSKHAGTFNDKNFQQLSLTLTSQFTKHWSVVGMLKQNLEKKEDGGGPLERGVGLIYRDECFGLGLSVKRQYYRDRDLGPETIVLATLFLKNVGDYSYSFNMDGGLFGERTTQPDTP